MGKVTFARTLVFILLLGFVTGCGQNNTEKSPVNEKKVIRIGY